MDFLGFLEQEVTKGRSLGWVDGVGFFNRRASFAKASKPKAAEVGEERGVFLSGREIWLGGFGGFFLAR